MGSLLGYLGVLHLFMSTANIETLDPRAIKCVFLGYSFTKKSYKCYNPSTRKFYTSTDVTFIKNKHFFPKSSLQGDISMMEDSPCESFEPLNLPYVLTHGDEEPESSEPITPDSPNSTIESVSSLFQPVSLAIFHSFLRCIQGKRQF